MGRAGRAAQPGPAEAARAWTGRPVPEDVALSNRAVMPSPERCSRRRVRSLVSALCAGETKKVEPVQLNLPPRSGDGPPQGEAFRGTATGLNGMVACPEAQTYISNPSKP